MKIAIIGASGFVGSAILTEALERGHLVSAIVRNTDLLPVLSRLSALKGNVFDVAATAAQLKGHDAVISAFFIGRNEEIADICQANIDGTKAIIAATKAAGLNRILIVGGAGSLEIAPGVQLVDTPQFPQEIRPKALAAREALQLIRQEQELEWSYISPSPILKPGEKTGHFRIGGEQVLMTGQGPTDITLGDLAVAILDEIEQPRHIRKRFTVGY
jgi:putative NADH-flavin reductase